MSKIKLYLRKLSLQTHSWIIAIATIVIGILICVGTFSGPGYLWTFAISAVLLVLILIYAWLTCRCPYCDTLLATRLIPEYCPHCGKKLEK